MHADVKKLIDKAKEKISSYLQEKYPENHEEYYNIIKQELVKILHDEEGHKRSTPIYHRDVNKIIYGKITLDFETRVSICVISSCLDGQMPTLREIAEAEETDINTFKDNTAEELYADLMGLPYESTE